MTRSIRFLPRVVLSIGIHLILMSHARPALAADETKATGLPENGNAAHQIVWHVKLPRASFLTIAIDDEKGDRVRNLFAEKESPAGVNAVAWDGLDDSGKPAPPGRYRWRGLYRDAIHLEYQFSVYHGGATLPWFSPGVQVATDTGWLSDHNPCWSVCAAGDKIFVGAVVSENGHDIMALDHNGKKLWGVSHPYGCGASDLAYDGRYVYGAGEAQWAGDNAMVYRIDPQTFQHELLWSHKGQLGFRGIAAREGKLYLASDLLSKILILDLTTKQLVGEIPLPHPGGLGFMPYGKLIAGSGQQIVIVDDGGKNQPLITDHLTHINRLTVAPDGTIYVSDGPASWQHDNSADAVAVYGKEDVRFLGDNQVKVFNAGGKFLRAIGTAGGRRPGKYDPQAMRCPVGISVDSANRLWVAEWDMLPKRISVWDAPSGQLTKELLGGPRYGGGGALDPGDHTQMIFDGMRRLA